MPDADRDVLEEYIEVLEQAHFKEEQRAYYQGIMDGVELLGGLGLIKKGSNMKKAGRKVERIRCEVVCVFYIPPSEKFR